METRAPVTHDFLGYNATVSKPPLSSQSNGVVRILPAAMTAALFLALFGPPFISLAKDWWQLPEAGHGLLLAPAAVWLAWRSGIRDGAAPNHKLGAAILILAILIRYTGGLAAEFFTTRESIVLALAGITVYHYGFRQILWWWLPFALAALAVPLPELVTQAVALPLQFKASRIGATMLESRHVPVRLTGNIIRIPGRELFVTEACSGLRSLTALLSVGVLLGGVTLRYPVSRLLLLGLAIPIAVLINGIRVFLTGFLVYYVSPSLGEGFMHVTEGWLLFLVSFASLGLIAWVMVVGERRFAQRDHRND